MYPFHLISTYIWIESLPSSYLASARAGSPIEYADVIEGAFDDEGEF